jgi:hypothetical protein
MKSKPCKILIKLLGLFTGCGSMRPSKILELKDMNDDHLEDSPPRIYEKAGTQHYGSFYLRIGAVGLLINNDDT